MRDVKTGKIYFAKTTCEELGPAFAKAGYDIRRIHTLEQALRVWLTTFSDETAQEFLRVVEERRKKLPIVAILVQSTSKKPSDILDKCVSYRKNSGSWFSNGFEKRYRALTRGRFRVSNSLVCSNPLGRANLAKWALEGPILLGRHSRT